MSPSLSLRHYKSKAVAINDADPDDGNDWRCETCLLPIFSTLFVDKPDGGRMHDQCANKIPERLEDHPLHPGGSLVRQNLRGIDRVTHCFRCKSKCGAMFYVCPDTFYCEGFTLDLACALEIKIIHQSHKHELTATMGSSCSFICSACGTQHDRPKRGEWGVSYVCSPCDFWIHPDCVVLPTAIEIVDNKVHVHDEHPLLLTYGNSADELWRLLRLRIRGTIQCDYKCAICGGGGDDSKGLGWYRCFHCNYSVHINCIVYSHPHPQSFKQVLLRDAKVPGLIHLPMANEHQSVIQRIMNSTAGTIDCAISSSSSYNSKVHQHPLVINQPLLRNNNNIDDDDDDRVCNACVHLISPSEAFYSCKVKNKG